MTRSQELALSIIEENEIANEAAMDWLRERVAELESENAELRAELEERDSDLTDVQNMLAYLAPAEPLLRALHAALLAQDSVHLTSTINGYHLVIGDVTISARSPRANDVVMAVHRVALDFTGEGP